MREALRKTITMLTHDLITDPPLQWDYNPHGADTFLCYLCRESVPVIYDPPGHPKFPCGDYHGFPHSGTCPVTLARHIEELLEGEPE